MMFPLLPGSVWRKSFQEEITALQETVPGVRHLVNFYIDLLKTKENELLLIVTCRHAYGSLKVSTSYSMS